MLNVYKDFLENYLAIPVILGKKTESEKFPGAVDTYCFETMMQDKKAIQGGTSHYLGQNFAKSSNITFNDEDGKIKHVYTTSWGVTTRLIGALIMVHSDDDGLVLPPKIAPTHVAILPIIHDGSVKEKVLLACEEFKKDLEKKLFNGKNIEVEIDTRDLRGGEKKWDLIKKGTPLLVEIGPKDIEKNSVFVTQRDDLQKKSYQREEFISNIEKILEDMQKRLFEKAKNFLSENTVNIDDKSKFYEFFTPKNKEKPEIHGGFVSAHFCLDENEEEQIKKDLSVSIRCIPLKQEEKGGKCIFCDKLTKTKVIFAKAY